MGLKVIHCALLIEKKRFVFDNVDAICKNVFLVQTNSWPFQSASDAGMEQRGGRRRSVAGHSIDVINVEMKIKKMLKNVKRLPTFAINPTIIFAHSVICRLSKNSRICMTSVLFSK